MTSPELISFIKKQRELNTPEINYRQGLYSQGWKPEDIDEALATLSLPNQTNTSLPLPSNPKGYGLLIWTEVILITLLVIGYILGNKAGRASSLNDLLSFIGIILIVPGFIVGLIGVKDAVVSFKNNANKAILILLLSLFLLLIACISGAPIYKTFSFLI